MEKTQAMVFVALNWAAKSKLLYSANLCELFSPVPILTIPNELQSSFFQRSFCKMLD